MFSVCCLNSGHLKKKCLTGFCTFPQDAFDGIEKELREELTPEQGQELEAMFQHMSVERLELLLLQLFECIMLHLSEPRSQDDDTHPENFRSLFNPILICFSVCANSFYLGQDTAKILLQLHMSTLL